MIAARCSPENHQGDSVGSFGQHQRWLQALEAAARKADPQPLPIQKKGGKVTSDSDVGETAGQTSRGNQRFERQVDWLSGTVQVKAPSIIATHCSVAAPPLAGGMALDKQPASLAIASNQSMPAEQVNSGADDDSDGKAMAKVLRTVQWVLGEKVQPRSVMAFIGGDGRVRVWIRDANIVLDEMQSTAEGLNRGLSRDGLCLGELNVNGKLVWALGR